MKPLHKIVFLSLLGIIFITGCATQRGLDRNDLVSSNASSLETDEEIEAILSLKPQLNFPFRLGVFVVENNWGYFRNRALSKAVHGNESNIQNIVTELKSKNIISDIVVLPNSLVKKRTIEDIRTGAARLGVDAVLVINAFNDVDRYNNFTSFLYLSIIGLWIIPGTNVDGLSVIQGTLFDVRNGYLYFTLESEGRVEKVAPSQLIENKDVAIASLNQATLRFIEQLKSKLSNLK